MLVEHVQPHILEMPPSTLCLMDSYVSSKSKFIQHSPSSRAKFLMVIVHISKYEYTQKVWRAREKHYSRGKGLLLGGYNTGILMGPDDLVFFY